MKNKKKIETEPGNQLQEPGIELNAAEKDHCEMNNTGNFFQHILVYIERNISVVFYQICR